LQSGAPTAPALAHHGGAGLPPVLPGAT